MASGKTPDRPKAADFARPDGDGTDPTAQSNASEEIVSAPGDRTNPNASSRPTFKLAVLHGPKAGEEFPLDADEVTLGRGTDNTITIPDVSVSRHHIRFEREGDGFTVVDLKSGNGTKVNGKREERFALIHGDEIVLGDTVLQILDLAQPVPPRYRGAPELKPQKSTASVPPPSSSAATESRPSVPVTAAVTDTAPSSEPVPPPPPPAAKPKPAAKKNGRMGLYGVIFVLMIVFFGAAAVLKNGRPSFLSGLTLSQAAAGNKTDNLIEQARQMARDRKWTDALSLLVHEGPARPDETVTKWTDGVRFESTAQQAYQRAEASLIRGDYKVALDLAAAIDKDADFGEDAQEKIIKRMPEILRNALVDARTAFHSGDKERCKDIVGRVLLASPTNADALAVKAECSYVAPIVHNFISTPPPPPEPPLPTGPSYKCFGPAVTSYLQDRIAEAIGYAGKGVIASCPGLDAKLAEFQQHRSKGQDAAQSKHVPEAAHEFSEAAKIDDYIAEGRASAPGKQVNDQLSRMEFLLGLDAKGDDQLPNRSKHMRAAGKANPDNELAKKELNKCYDRAHEIFKEAYAEKASDKDAAIKGFRIVFATLPEGDEFKAKSKYWLDNLTKK